MKKVENRPATDRSADDEGEIVLIDKPLGWTSFDVVKKMRSVLQARKIGHAGTLDPRATGLLIVCTGKKTKSVDKYSSLPKEYTGTMELGVRTPSFDSETEVTEVRVVSHVTTGDLRAVAQSMIGKQLQVPPMYSAAKHAGKPLYKYARRGNVVERKARDIEIFEFDILECRLPHVDFRVSCSKGTYIRALTEDFGVKLGTGATLRSLRRTRVGQFHVDHAWSIEQLVKGRQHRIFSPENAHESRPPA